MKIGEKTPDSGTPRKRPRVGIRIENFRNGIVAFNYTEGYEVGIWSRNLDNVDFVYNTSIRNRAGTNLPSQGNQQQWRELIERAERKRQEQDKGNR